MNPYALDSVRLRDGRELAYAEYGDPSGTPVVYFPGLGHDRLGCGGAGAGTRLIVVDRPGLGASTRQHGRAIEDFAEDIEQLADMLGIGSFGALAWSAGASYALACAAALGDRIPAVTVAGGMAPPELCAPRTGMDPTARVLLGLARRSGQLVISPMALLRFQAQHHSELLMRVLYAGAPACDRAVLARSEVRTMYRSTYRSATRAGVAGVVDELVLVSRPWNLPLTRVRGSAIRLVYGAEDTLTPWAVGLAVSRALDGCTLDTIEGAGHTLVWRHWRELLAEVTGRTASAPRDAV